MCVYTSCVVNQYVSAAFLLAYLRVLQIVARVDRSPGYNSTIDGRIIHRTIDRIVR